MNLYIRYSNQSAGKDPKIAKELYLNLDNLTMKKLGMSFGSHGNTHRWLIN